MPDINFVLLKGRVVKDAIFTVTNSHAKVCEFRLAVKLSPKVTEYHQCKVWGDRAEDLAPKLTKGTETLVEGVLRAQSYEKAGQKRTSVTITAQRVAFMDGEEKPQAAESADEDAPW